MRRKPFGIGGFILLVILFNILLNVSDFILPLLLMAGGVGYLAYRSAKEAKKLDDQPYGRTTRTSRKTAYSYTGDQGHSAAEKARVNTYLMKRFADQNSIRLSVNGNGYVLTNTASRFRSIDMAEITVNGRAYISGADYRRSDPQGYEALFSTVLNLAMQDVQTKPGKVVDADFVPSGTKRTEEKRAEETPAQPKAEPVDDALRFRDVINSLNDDIPDEEISNGLYETTALLKQLCDLEKSFPASKPRLRKLYKQYLPYLVNILQQYTKMQNVQTDPNYKENEKALKGTIAHINSAMRDRLIPGMSENDSANLSADMSTLESMLRKDGMSDEGDIAAALRKNKEESATESRG